MPAANSTLALVGVLDVTTVAAQWPRLCAGMRGIERIDLSAVTSLDSSGVALIRCLQTLASKDGPRPTLTKAPPRLAQIGLAHRVGTDGN